MPLSPYFLDEFVARELSLLTECGAPELPPARPWLNVFILSRFTGAGAAILAYQPHAYVFNFLRRAEAAFSTYHEARNALVKYIECRATPQTVISPYFRSLLNFEVCISQCWQGRELLETARQKTASQNKKNKTVKGGKNSDMTRLDALYNDAKHMDRFIYQGKKLPGAGTAGIWITNHGLKGTKTKRGISFKELAEILKQMGLVADTLSGGKFD